MFASISIEKELQKEKEKEKILLSEAVGILKKEEEAEWDILNRVESGCSLKQNLTLTDENVYTYDQIKAIAIRYRLRFLSSNLYKSDIPYEAILKIKELEKKHEVKFTDFKILAPASLFKLENRNKDPLLFASIGNERYLLIHKWGNDFAWYRKFLVFPLRSLKNFIITVLTISLLITLLIPCNYPTRLFVFLILNLFCFVAFCHIGYLRLNQNFSEFEWDNKYIG
jgi:hypothetical protein